MKTQAILITGACGEIGHSLIEYLCRTSELKIIALDLQIRGQNISSPQVSYVAGDILDKELLANLSEQYTFKTIFHLAALLSSSSEREPYRAHQVNVNGSVGLLQLAQTHSLRTGEPVTFLFPSSIAVYGGDNKPKTPVNEDQYLDPITVHGINKLYIEKLGHYFTHHFGMLQEHQSNGQVDFRSIRFPGILSADTLPSGGTSDYGPEMVHAAAQGQAYECFVRADSRIPFIAMPDAIKALIKLSEAGRRSLTRSVYNINGFSISASEILTYVRKHYGSFEVTFNVNPKRQSMIDSWPFAVDDTAAAKDWGWKADLSAEATFSEYLVPRIQRRYT